MAAPNEITPNQLLRRIGLPDAPQIIDICLDEDFDKDPVLIPGAVRYDYKDIEGLSARLNGQAVIVFQKGLKLSQGVASRLHARGIAAEYLSGGMVGWRGTPDAPVISNVLQVQPSLWVTRHRPKIDRIACPWLIRRFVDREAEFMFVSPEQVQNVAERFGAIPFDVPNVALGHVEDRCTFDALLTHFGMVSDALDRMASVIRAADTGANHVPQAAGLLALSVGMSRMYRDDHAQLDAALPMYDALYRWARDGHNETHDSRAAMQ